MNDHDAMTAINEVLEVWSEGEIREHRALMKIATICGRNHFEHEKAKAKP